VEPARNVTHSVAGGPKMASRPVSNQSPAIKVLPKEKPAPVIVQKVAAPAPAAKAEEDVVKDKVVVEEKVTEKKEMYETVCDTCEQKIYVPFKPDPSRPAFCKECLKDYQRAMAKARLQQQTNDNPQPEVQKIVKVKLAFEQKIEHKSYAPTDRPMSLSQMTHIAPKKFKPQRQKPNVNPEEVRNLIQKTKSEQ